MAFWGRGDKEWCRKTVNITWTVTQSTKTEGLGRSLRLLACSPNKNANLRRAVGINATPRFRCRAQQEETFICICFKFHAWAHALSAHSMLIPRQRHTKVFETLCQARQRSRQRHAKILRSYYKTTYAARFWKRLTSAPETFGVIHIK